MILQDYFSDVLGRGKELNLHALSSPCVWEVNLHWELNLHASFDLIWLLHFNITTLCKCDAQNFILLEDFKLLYGLLNCLAILILLFFIVLCNLSIIIFSCRLSILSQSEWSNEYRKQKKECIQFFFNLKIFINSNSLGFFIYYIILVSMFDIFLYVIDLT